MYICTCTYIWIYICIYVYICTCTYIWIYIYIYIPYISIYIYIYTSDIPSVSGNNDVIKRLSCATNVSSKKLQEGASLCLHEKLPIKYCIAAGIKTDKHQPQKLCISVAFTRVSKLGHPENAFKLSINYQTTQNYNKDENRLVDVCIFICFMFL